MKTIYPYLLSFLFLGIVTSNSFGQRNPDKFIAIGLQTDAQWLYQDNPRIPISNSIGLFYQNYLFSNWSISLSWSLAQRGYHNSSQIDFSNGGGPMITSNSIFLEKSRNLKASVKYYIHTRSASYFANIGTVRKTAFRTRGELQSSYTQLLATPVKSTKTDIDLGFDFGIGVEFDAFENMMVAVQVGSLLFLNQDRGTINRIDFYTEIREGGINNFYLELQLGYTLDFQKLKKLITKKR